MSEIEITAIKSIISDLSSRIELITSQLAAVGVFDRESTHIMSQVTSNATKATVCNQYDFYLNSCEASTGGGSSGDTAFIILCSALVLLMVIPGLGLYYGGMVKPIHIESVLLNNIAVIAVTSCMFMFFGYSLALGSPNSTSGGKTSLFYGDASRLWYWGINPSSVHELAPTIPESTFALYQLCFCVVTHSLVCGALADKVKFYPHLLFMILWHIVVYCPVAHANWHPDGFLYQAGVMDFAGGNVVHISSGFAGLAVALIVGKSRRSANDIAPNNVLLTYIGASMLWLGWYGFNSGSALSATARAGQALLNTQISASAGAISWMGLDWYIVKKPSMLAMLSGGVAGLVAITPASGNVDQTGAFFIGLLAGPFCYGGASLKHYLGYDDALDAFGVHASGGLVGGILTGFFASPAVYGPFETLTTRFHAGVFYNIGDSDGHQTSQLGAQAYGVFVTAFYSFVMSYLLIKMLDATIGTKSSPNDDTEQITPE